MSYIQAFADTVETILNTIIGLIIIFFVFILVIQWLNKKLKINKINFFIEKILNFLIESIPSKPLKNMLIHLFNIEPETFILLPKASDRSYKYLGYQLNGLNRFLERNENCAKKIKIILIDNSTSTTTDENINKFVKSLSSHKRYIIIVTMSDIFDSLLGEIGYKFKKKKYRQLIKIICTLASHSERYKDYEGYENIIRLSPPDFDEARKAASNIVSKLISSYCPSKECHYHKNNNVILISSNSYGEAVKKSFLKLFSEYKEEFDTYTNIDVDAKELDKGIFKFAYHYEDEDKDKKGIIRDNETNYDFDNLLKEKTKNAINTIFIIGYEPNISHILNHIDSHFQKCDKDHTFTILISATASVKEWRESIINTVKNLRIKDQIKEINFINIQYPEFRSTKPYRYKKIFFKLYKLDTSKNSPNLVETKLTLKQEDIKEIIFSDDMNYINGFIYMALEFVQQIHKEWNINLLSLKERLFQNKDRNYNDISGIKILSSGDSINHFKVKRLDLDYKT